MWLKYKIRRLFLRIFLILNFRVGSIFDKSITKSSSQKKFFKILSKYKNNFALQIYGNKFYYDLNTDIGEVLFLSGQFENNEILQCKKYVSKESVVIDIGANIGLHSVYFSNWASNGMVFSFEPAHNTFTKLVKNINKHQNVFPLNIALSDESGLKTFYETIDNAYSGFKDTKRKSIKSVSKILAYNLDDFFNKIELDRIDLIKIDVEGSEQEVVTGMIKTISKYKPVIFCEIYKGTNSNPNPILTIDTIVSYGYTPFVLKEFELVDFQYHDDNFHNYFFLPN
jgi:FkbM family methyltransferase